MAHDLSAAAKVSDSGGRLAAARRASRRRAKFERGICGHGVRLGGAGAARGPCPSWEGASCGKGPWVQGEEESGDRLGVFAGLDPTGQGGSDEREGGKVRVLPGLGSHAA